MGYRADGGNHSQTQLPLAFQPQTAMSRADALSRKRFCSFALLLKNSYRSVATCAFLKVATCSQGAGQLKIGRFCRSKTPGGTAVLNGEWPTAFASVTSQNDRSRAGCLKATLFSRVDFLLLTSCLFEQYFEPVCQGEAQACCSGYALACRQPAEARQRCGNVTQAP